MTSIQFVMHDMSRKVEREFCTFIEVNGCSPKHSNELVKKPESHPTDTKGPPCLHMIRIPEDPEILGVRAK